MGFQVDLDEVRAPIHFTRRAPGAVRDLDAHKEPCGDLTLRWLPPSGITRIDGCRIERTREGREYELLAETDDLQFTITNPQPGEPWFYRVTAFNLHGIGRARMVYFHRRGARLRLRGRILRCMSFPIPVIPGVRLHISED